MKWRNSKERELLAAGGSREQTLPNKNNPHPDLSDADGDRPKLDLSDVQVSISLPQSLISNRMQCCKILYTKNKYSKSLKKLFNTTIITHQYKSKTKHK